MSTSRPSTCKWSKPAAAAGALGLALCLAGAPGGRSEPPPTQRDLPPFLQLFKGDKAPPVGGKQISFASAIGTGTGYVARPETREVLPAVLLIAGEEGLTDWLKESARDLASVGYVVLAVAPPPGGAHPDEQALAESWAALRWLRRRTDVLPDRVGVVGWSRGGGLALELAAAAPVQACVVCDAPVPEDPALVPRLRGTAVLGLFAGQDSAAQKALPAFRKALAEARLSHKVHVYDGARAGFMGPPERKAYDREAADRAWVEVYEFLGKYVEDAAPACPAAAPTGAAPAVATIADLMRAVNEPTGVRGALIQALEQEPAGPRQWERVRADAALIAEAGTLLQGRTPPKGSRAHWLEQARAFTAAAESLVSAADRRDYPAARRGLKELGERCAACHEQHR
jgi:dienelactone hydrolase